MEIALTVSTLILADGGEGYRRADFRRRGSCDGCRHENHGGQRRENRQSANCPSQRRDGPGGPLPGMPLCGISDRTTE